MSSCLNKLATTLFYLDDTFSKVTNLYTIWKSTHVLEMSNGRVTLLTHCILVDSSTVICLTSSFVILKVWDL